MDPGHGVRTSLREESSPLRWPERVAADVGLHRVALIVWLLSFSIMVPVFAHLSAAVDDGLYGYNDHEIHLEQAEGTSLLPPRINAPHPVYQLIVRSLSLVLPVGAAAVVVLSAAAATTSTIIHTWARRESVLGPALPAWGAAAVAGLVLVMETPVAMLNTFGVLDPPRTFMASQLWANPTDVVVMPLALLMIQVGVQFASEEPAPAFRPSRTTLLLLLLSVVVTLTKTAASLALVPGVFIYLLVTGRLSRLRLVRFAVWCLVPVAAVMLWQSWFVRTSEISQELGYTSYGLAIDAFRYVPLMGFGPSGPWFFWTPLLPIALAVWAGRRRFLQHPPIQVCLAALPGTLFLALFVTETGLDVDGQDLMRPLVFSVLPLLYLSVVALAQSVARVRGRAGRSINAAPWLVPVAVVAALWLVGGAFLYLDAIGIPMPHPTSPPPWPPP